MKNTLIFILALFLINSGLSAQINEFKKMEWGVIPKADLEMQVYPLDSSAQAVVLGVEGRMIVSAGSRNFEYSLIQHKRIKILDKLAADKYGNVSLLYYHEGGAESIRQLKAHTIAPDGTVNELDKKDFYREKINDYWTKITFAFTNIKTGSVLEYRYQLNSNRVFSPEEWSFREEIPVRSSYFKFRNDAPLVFSYHLKGVEYLPYEKGGNNGGVFEMDQMKIWIKDTEFFMINGEALTEEPYMTTIDDYKITVYLQYNGLSQGYDALLNSSENAWKGIAVDLLRSENMGLHFSIRNRSKKIIKSSASVISTDAEPAEKLFQIKQFITSNITWNGEEDIVTTITPDEAFSLRKADLAAIQYAGLALLHHYGFEAYPVILSTRDNGSMINNFPFVEQFNYVILLVFLDGKLKMLDLSDPLLPIGKIRLRAFNKEGFLIREEDPAWIDIKPSSSQDIYVIKAQINEDASITAEMKSMFKNYSAREDRALLSENKMEKIWLDRLQNGAQIDTISCENQNEINEALSYNIKFNLPEAGFSNGDMIYLSPILYTSFKENPFKIEKRVFPIDFAYPFEEKSIYIYSIPNGYQVEALPEKIDIQLPNKEASFLYLAKEVGEEIQIRMILSVKKVIFNPDEYKILKDLFENAVEKMGEQIVLKKIQ